MPFRRDAHVVPSNTVSQGFRSPHRKGRFTGWEPPVGSDAVCWQITLAVVQVMTVSVVSAVQLAVIAVTSFSVSARPNRHAPRLYTLSTLCLSSSAALSVRYHHNTLYTFSFYRRYRPPNICWRLCVIVTVEPLFRPLLIGSAGVAATAFSGLGKFCFCVKWYLRSCVAYPGYEQAGV